MKLVTLKTFDNPIDAHLLQSKLENEGIESFLLNENMIGLNPLFNNALGGIQLKINNNDIDAALKVIQELNDAPLTDENNEIVKCPKCGSTEIFSNFKSFRNLKGILSLITSFLFSIYPLYAKQVKKCKQCSYEF